MVASVQIDYPVIHGTTIMNDIREEHFMTRFSRLFVICAALSALSVGCKPGEPAKAIDPAKTETTKADNSAHPSAGLRIAVGGMITPKEGFAYYREFLDYIGRKLGEPVHYVDAENYNDLNKKLKQGELDAGFVCSGPYVDGKKDFGLELLAAPRAYGKTFYHAYIIVPAGSTAKTLNDLKGKRFAFTDPLSNTGKLVPEYIVSKTGGSSDTFFSKTQYSGSHDKSIIAVAEGLVDGASVDSLIWDYIAKTKPELAARTRIILKSDPYAIPPFVVRPGLKPEQKERLKTVLLTAHNDAEGKAILDKMMIERFETIDDKAYDSIRDMKRRTGKK